MPENAYPLRKRVAQRLCLDCLLLFTPFVVFQERSTLYAKSLLQVGNSWPWYAGMPVRYLMDALLILRLAIATAGSSKLGFTWAS